MAKVLLTFAFAIWFGGGLAVLFGIRAIFGAAESRNQGRDFSVALLRSFIWTQVGALFCYLGSELTAWFASVPAPNPHGLGQTLAIAFIADFAFDASLRKLRREMGSSTKDVDPADRRREELGRLRSLSLRVMFLLVVKVVAAGFGLFRLAQ